MRRTIEIAVAVAAGVALVLAITSGGSSPYRLKLHVADADGLRDGSPVVIGGVSVGKVHLSTQRQFATVELKLDHKYAPVGRDATATIVAQNVLGQKQVTVVPGNRSNPAPSGYVLPGRQTAASADLDQLLSTLDAPTRSRLAVLVNELGTAFYGRQLDFHQFVGEVVPALESGQNLLGQLGSENVRLGKLLDHADAFVSSLAASRAEIANGLDAVGQATQTFAERRESLRATLHAAPGALATTRSFLADLQATTRPLAATARLLSATAPSLQSTLDRIAPFTAAAKPALEAAADQTAPALRRLGVAGTPDIAALLPTLVNASALVRQQVPAVGDAVNGSVDNLLALLDNWAHAIQFKDGISHVFRGEATIAPSEYTRLLANLGINPASKAQTKRRPGQRPDAQAPAPASGQPSRAPQLKLPVPVHGVAPVLNKTLGAVQKVVSTILGHPQSQSQPAPDNAQSLLDYLLKP